MVLRSHRSAGYFAHIAASIALILVLSAATNGWAVQGHYLETRTCQVYTGPCFANAEVGLCGKEAVLAWSIEEGEHAGVDLAGLKVVMAMKASKTFEFGGIEKAGDIKSVIYVDDKASREQEQALVDFAKHHSGRAGERVVRVTRAPISMSLNISTLKGKLNVDDDVRLSTRKARPEDCICHNETAYYAPLVALKHFAPGVAEVDEFRGRGLGVNWSQPNARSVYMATFDY